MDDIPPGTNVANYQIVEIKIHNDDDIDVVFSLFGTEITANLDETDFEDELLMGSKDGVSKIPTLDLIQELRQRVREKYANL